ncbi:MAG TPA: hypothetical protein VN516_06905, partial [Candidatus Baltobacteraceae bacterium]|nr:hypothetical protein [Candidatus Baltobacteraceae bacterium]
NYSQSNYQPQPDQSADLYSPSSPSGKRLGVGVVLGEPVGVSVKYWLNDKMAVDGAAGFSAHNNSPFYFHSDVLWHRFDVFDVSPAPGKLPIYFGVGGLVRIRDHGDETTLGIRAPIGVSYLFDNAPIDIFAEIGPAIDVHPTFKGEITGGIGVRFWF